MGRVLMLLVLLGLPASVRASWRYVPLERLVQESDLIVVGTLRDVSEHRAGETDYGEGRIDVREVIWGDAAPGEPLPLRWRNAAAVICPRVEHRHNAGTLGVWLLTRDGDAVGADYPGRFVGLSERRRVAAALRNSPVVLRADKYVVKPGEPMRFSVVYRNPSDAPRVFPALAFEGGDLRVSQGPRPALTVTLDGGGACGVARLSGRVVRDAGLAPVTVPPRGEHRAASLDLRAMLAAEPGEKYSYVVTLKFDGLPPTNELGFYVGEPLAPGPAEVPAGAPGAEPAGPSPAPRAPHANEFTGGRAGFSPRARAGLAALAALLLFPFFRRLRSALAGARLARVLRGTQTWQI